MLGDDDEEDEDDERMEASPEPTGPANGGGRRQKKPETEEEKRRNFLERNRQAALKCRQRKKAWLSQLQAKVEFLTNENERLTSALVSSREEISRLSSLVGSAGIIGANSNGPSVGAPVGAVNGQPVAMNVSVSGKPALTAGGPGRSTSGYGY
jgi:ATF/CREB family transcription factor